MTLAALGAAAVAVAAFTQRAPDLLIYNHSPSITVGFYLRAYEPVSAGQVVTVRASAVAPVEARARGFEDSDDRFIKRVAAVAGQRVCGDGEILSIDGVRVARAYRGDGAERATWVGCRTLRTGEVLLLGDTSDSFDGRYWGPISVTLIDGVWRKL